MKGEIKKSKSVKSEEPVKKCTTRSSSKKIKKEDSDIEEVPQKVKTHEEVLVEDDEVDTCSITGISLSELSHVRCEVMKEMVQFPQHLRTRYYFEQSLEVKVQTYFGISDPEKLNKFSTSDPFKVGDEVIVAHYEQPAVMKRDVSKPTQSSSEEGASSSTTDSDDKCTQGSVPTNYEETEPEFEDGSAESDIATPSLPVVPSDVVGRGSCDVAKCRLPVVQLEVVGRGSHDVATEPKPKPDLPPNKEEVVGGGSCDVDTEPKPKLDLPNKEEVVGGGSRDVNTKPKPQTRLTK